MAAGKHKVAEASSTDLLSEPQSFELFTVNPHNKCKAYRYAYGTSVQVILASSTRCYETFTPPLEYHMVCCAEEVACFAALHTSAQDAILCYTI